MDKHVENKSQDSSVKKSPFEDLSRDELIVKCKGLLAIAQKAKHAKSELQIEADKYKSQLQECESDKKIKLDNLQMLQELVDSLTEQKLTFITELDSLQSKVRALNNKCSFYEEAISNQNSEMLLKDQNLSTASQNLSDLDSEVISLKRQNNRLLEENEQLITQLTELEAKIEEFNNIGLQQREQLKVLEEKALHDESYQKKIEELNNKIKDLEMYAKESAIENKPELIEYENRIEEVTTLYEIEKSKLDKANIKLRSYKDKILKCANCINQLKNSRFILTKTVKEYSENIPKWQNEIINESKAFDLQMQKVNDENIFLKAQLVQKEKEINDISSTQSQTAKLNNQINELQQENENLHSQLYQLNQKLDDILKCNETLHNEIIVLKSKEFDVGKLEDQIQENNSLTDQLNVALSQLSLVTTKVKDLETTVKALKDEKSKLNEKLKSKEGPDETKEKMYLQIKALESEKSIVVNEKLNAKDSVIDLENQNKILNDQLNNLKIEFQTIKEQFETLSLENMKIKKDYKLEKENSIQGMKNETLTLKEQYDKLKKEYENLQDLNGLLQEEVETLKLSLEQPKDDPEPLTDLNVSLQADIVKLDTKLSAYKQENASLLIEVKEFRGKVKEFDNLSSELEETKSKLINYKTENTELLNEMKEINQVLKERGESISKLQKAVSEMERLIETLEKDRAHFEEEKVDLLKKVDILENELKNVHQNNLKLSQEKEKIVSEKDSTLKSLHEKDTIISVLKEDLEKLKHQSCTSVELPNDDMSTSTISKAEEYTRMKDLDETFEDKYTKLRMFALKLKKKLNETTAQLQTSEQEKAKLKNILADCNLENKQRLSRDVVDGHKIENEIQNSDLFDLETKLIKTTSDLEVSIAKMESLEADILTKKQELAAEFEAHRSTKEQLEKTLKDVKKKNVLSLEIEAYEKSMKDLTTKMEENKRKIIQMESTIDTQEGTITATKTQIKLLEEQIKSEETQNRLLKEELQQTIEVVKEKDNVIHSKNEIITNLIQELEDEKRKNEEADLEMTAVLSDKEKIIMSFGDERTEFNSRTKKLEFKCSELNEKLQMTNIELADLKTEYTSYKVRAQAVLRQNQTIDHSQEEQLKEEAAALKAQVDTLTHKLTTAQEQSSEFSVEVEASRKRVSEASAETARAHSRTARLQADLTRLSQQLESERSQHKLQVSTLTQCYKSQINELEAKLLKETENFKKQIVNLQENAQAGRSEEESSRDKYLLPVIPREEGSDGEMDINVSLIPREEGEGSESAPSPPLSKSLLSNSGRRSPVPLERLLEEGVPENDSLDTSSLGLTPEQEIADLKRKILAQQQRVKHVTVLLAESAREGARLGQLSDLLKAELRRVRASANNAHNTEYMKNVTLKFLTLPPGDERSRLVPVLQKILTLSADEAHKIQAIAKGQDPNPSKGWGSYLPWPGGK